MLFFWRPQKKNCCVVESSLGPAPSHLRFLQFEYNPGLRKAVWSGTCKSFPEASYGSHEDQHSTNRIDTCYIARVCFFPLLQHVDSNMPFPTLSFTVIHVITAPGCPSIMLLASNQLTDKLKIVQGALLQLEMVPWTHRDGRQFSPLDLGFTNFCYKFSRPQHYQHTKFSSTFSQPRSWVLVLANLSGNTSTSPTNSPSCQLRPRDHFVAPCIGGMSQPRLFIVESWNQIGRRFVLHMCNERKLKNVHTQCSYVSLLRHFINMMH